VKSISAADESAAQGTIEGAVQPAVGKLESFVCDISQGMSYGDTWGTTVTPSAVFK
jgi:hypothetical protein